MSNEYDFRQCPAGSVPYNIRSGDTLTKIAINYKTTVNDIISANPTLNPNALVIGQLICVPTEIQIYPSCPTTNYYVVRPGDTFESIARYFNITYYQLIFANYGIPTDLYIDQILCIPVAPPPVNVEVPLDSKTLIVYRNGEAIKTYNLQPQTPTSSIPEGTFKVIYKDLDTGEQIGARWIGLNEAGFGIRGINTPDFIENISEGPNIVLSNSDISEVFNLLPVGTIVKIF